MHTDIKKIAKLLVVEGKGILASDESIESANKTLDKVGIKPTDENRKRYREMLLTTKNLGNHTSGIILFDETIRQKDASNRLLTEYLKEEDVLIGIKVDKGLIDLPGFSDEKYTQGLDDLSKRLVEYKSLGATFTKWRSVIKIGHGIPTFECINTNVHTLALYAATVQQAGMVPIVEPEVLYEGEHSQDMCAAVTTEVLKRLFTELKTYKVDLSGLILKTGMVIEGNKFASKAESLDVAKATVAVLKVCVPEEVGGIVFLSGGQESQQAIDNLNEIGKLKTEFQLPWNLTFSYLRAIEGPALKVWAGMDTNIDIAQKTLLEQLQACARASLGTYTNN